MLSFKQRIGICVLVIAISLAGIYILDSKITGSAIRTQFLLKEWNLDKVEELENGIVYTYSRGNESLIIRTREFDTHSEAMNKFAYYYHLKNIRDPEFFDFKDMSIEGIYLNKFFGKGPWLIIIINEENKITEFIYGNREKGQEYSGNYDKDVAWLKGIAVKVLGE